MSQRIALMLPRFSTYGGAEGFSLRLARTLAQEGYDVDFICARQETLAPEGVNVIEVGRPPLGRAAKIAWYACAGERARRNGNYGLTLSMGKTMQQDILRMSGGPLEIFWRLSSRAYAKGLPRSAKMLRRRLAPANALIRRLELAALRNNRVCVTVSHRVRDWLLEAHPFLEHQNLRVIYNKPDLTRFTPVDDDQRTRLRRELGVDGDRLVLLLAGTNFALKGLGQLIQALEKLPDEAMLLVAGGRNPGRFQAQADKLGLGRRVTFLGRVEDMPAVYRACDIFCLPSFYDTCSNAVVEALACGARVISSRDNGSSVFLPEDQILEDPADVAAMAAAIQRVAALPRPRGFVWPEDIPAGLPPYLDLIRELMP